MQIQGHQQAIENLNRLVETRRLPHALLFSGPGGVGKKKVAVHFAQRLLCSSSHPACETCSVCLRVHENQHPDFILIAPEKGVIKIEAIRALKQALFFRPLEGSLKIAVIEEAHTLNLSASNALLKTLEEPPSQTLLILTSSSPYRLLKTILSRCQKIYFSPLHPREVEEVLKQEGKNLVSDFVKQWGSPGLALSISDEALQMVDEKILPALNDQPKDLMSLFSIAEEIAQDESLHQSVLWILQMRWKEKLKQNPDKSLFQKFEQMGAVVRSFEHYANPQLTFETLFLNLCL